MECRGRALLSQGPPYGPSEPSRASLSTTQHHVKVEVIAGSGIWWKPLITRAMRVQGMPKAVPSHGKSSRLLGWDAGACWILAEALVLSQVLSSL